MRIIIDMDDVMADASLGIINIYNEHFGTAYTKEMLSDGTLWDDELKQNYLAIRHKLHHEGFFRNLVVLPDAKKVIKQLHDKHEVFIVSAAMEFPNSLKEKHEWLGEHFPFISWKNMVLCGDKSIIKGDVIIDDHEKNLKTFDGDRLLFDAIHNQKLKGYKRVKSWKEVAEILL